MPRRTIEYVYLADVESAERNPKAHDDATLDASIDRFGFTEPPLVDERTGRLIAGHGRLERLRAREADGVEPPDGILATKKGWKLPVVRGWSSIDDAEADAYIIASNAVGEGLWHDDTLTEMLYDLQQRDDGLDGIGYDDRDLERFERLRVALSDIVPSAEDEWTSMPEFENPARHAAARATIHFLTEEDADAFFEKLGVERKSSMWWPKYDDLPFSDLDNAWVQDDDA